MSHSPPGCIDRIETATATLPLPRPLRVGASEVARREYSAVFVHAVDGLVGKAYCLSREAPMGQIVQRLIAPQVVGRDCADVAATWTHVFRSTAIVGRVGLVRRAMGLVDIALWDLAAQRAGVPVWHLLRRTRHERPAMLVACYPTWGRTTDELANEVLSHAATGWPLLKIARSPDRELMRDLLRQLATGLPASSRLVIDASFGWLDAEDAIADLSAWQVPEIAWVEDPLLPEDADGCARIRNKTGIRIGVGDEVTDPGVFQRLLDVHAIDVVRVDVVALGGITPAIQLIRQIEGLGLPISCHVYPEVTVHLGVGVETFERGPAGNAYDPAPMLVTGGPTFHAGTALPPASPGLGFDLDRRMFDFGRDR